MNNGIIAFIVLVGLVLLGLFGVLKLIGYLSTRYSRNLLRGHLREDYVRNNPDLARKGKVACHCGNTRILLRNLHRSGDDVIREHVCDQCGARLYLSASGEYLEAIIRELRKTCAA